jgi:hypothetical protein
MDYTSILIFLGCIFGLFGLGFVWVNYISPKLTQKDKDGLELLFRIVNHVAANYKFRFNIELSKASEICIEALQFCEQYELFTTTDEKKDAIFDKSLQLCDQYGIEVKPSDVDLIKEIVDYLVK